MNKSFFSNEKIAYFKIEDQYIIFEAIDLRDKNTCFMNKEISDFIQLHYNLFYDSFFNLTNIKDIENLNKNIDLKKILKKCELMVTLSRDSLDFPKEKSHWFYVNKIHFEEVDGNEKGICFVSFEKEKRKPIVSFRIDDTTLSYFNWLTSEKVVNYNLKKELFDKI